MHQEITLSPVSFCCLVNIPGGIWESSLRFEPCHSIRRLEVCVYCIGQVRYHHDLFVSSRAQPWSHLPLSPTPFFHNAAGILLFTAFSLVRKKETDPTDGMMIIISTLFVASLTPKKKCSNHQLPHPPRNARAARNPQTLEGYIDKKKYSPLEKGKGSGRGEGGVVFFANTTLSCVAGYLYFFQLSKKRKKKCNVTLVACSAKYV